MKVVAVLFVVFAAAQAGLIAPATTLVRTPSLDSAVIQSDRLGGNFAYSSVEGHAYAAVSPVVQNVVSPVGVSYSATPYLAPAVRTAYASPAVHSAYASPIVHSAYASPLVHSAYAAPSVYNTYAAHGAYGAPVVRLGY